MNALPRGRRLGVDVGKVRVGVALSDPDGILATPLVTVARDMGAAPDAVPGDIAELVRLVGGNTRRCRSSSAFPCASMAPRGLPPSTFVRTLGDWNVRSGMFRSF
nr:hypothetical protein GCM10020092_029450 [Actinoplanes digitatis]